MKKIIHFILVISLLMGLAPAAVFAEEDSGAQGLRGDIRDTLVSVGVLDADFSAWDQAAERGFAASVVMRMLGLNTEEITPQSGLLDVNAGTRYAGSITAACQLGYMAPYDDGYFYPENPINYAEISKMLVSALGYDRVAAANGGYPDGYMSLAQGFGIIKSADGTKEVSNRELYEMIYQAMDTNVLEIDGITGTGADFEEGDTLLNKYHDAVLVKGVVTEAAGTAIDFRDTVTKNNELAVGEYILKTAISDPLQYLGKKISAYIVADEEDSLYGTLLSVTKTEQAAEYEIHDEDMIVKENEDGSRTFTYQTENSTRAKNVRVPEKAMYYYNGRIIADINRINETLQNLYEGYVRIIHADSGWYVYIYEYYNIVVSGTNKASFSLKDTYTGSKVSFEDYQGNVYAYQRFYNGNEQIAFEDIKVGSVVSIFESLEEDSLTAYVCTESISGSVSRYNAEDGYVVEGKGYKLAMNIQEAMKKGQTDFKEIKLQDSVVFVLDYAGRVADFNIVRNDYIYSYLFACNPVDDGEMGDDYLYRLKLYNPNSGEAENFFAREKIKVNGVVMKSAGELDAHFQELTDTFGKVQCLVKVKFGADNTITGIETPVKTRAQDRLDFVYAGFTRVLSGRINGQYLVNNDTKIFEVSDSYQEVEPRTMSYINDYKNRDYILYVQDDLGFIDAIVLPNDTGAVTAKNEAIYYGDQVYMVKDASEGIVNEEDDEIGVIATVADGNKDLVLKESADGAVNVDQDIDGVHKNNNHNVPIKDGKQYGTWGYGYLKFNELKRGDLIQVDYDNRGGVNRFRVLARLDDIKDYFDICYLGLQTEPYSMLTYGRISYMNKTGFKLDYGTAATPKTRVYLNNTSAAVYIYNKTKRTMEVGAWNDVASNARVVVLAVKYGIKQVYVIEE